MDGKCELMNTICFLLLLCLPLLSKAENFAFCDGLSFQWKPITANYNERSPLEGTLIVTKESPVVQYVQLFINPINFLSQRRFGNFYLECNNNTKIKNSSISDIIFQPVSYIFINIMLCHSIINNIIPACVTAKL